MVNVGIDLTGMKLSDIVRQLPQLMRATRDLKGLKFQGAAEETGLKLYSYRSTELGKTGPRLDHLVDIVRWIEGAWVEVCDFDRPPRQRPSGALSRLPEAMRAHREDKGLSRRQAGIAAGLANDIWNRVEDRRNRPYGHTTLRILEWMEE